MHTFIRGLYDDTHYAWIPCAIFFPYINNGSNNTLEAYIRVLYDFIMTCVGNVYTNNLDDTFGYF